MTRKLFLVPAGWFIFITVIAYWAAFAFEFVHLDDTKYVIDNFSFNVRPSNVLRVFAHDAYYPSDISPYYRPLHVITYMIGTWIGGKSPAVFHGLNITLHFIASWLFFWLCIELGYHRNAAFAVGTFFALHPVHVFTIAWIPGNNDLLLGIFALLAFLNLVWFLKTLSIRNILGHSIFFLMALLTKETAAILPLLFAFYTNIAETRTPRKRLWSILIIGWSASIAIWFALRFYTIGGVILENTARTTQNIGTYFIMLLSYLGKTIFPIHLAPQPTIDNLSIMLGAGVIGLFLLWLFYSGERRLSKVFFGLTWFLALIIPTFLSNDFSSTPILMENRLYLPLMGISLILLEVDAIKNIKFRSLSTKLVMSSLVLCAFFLIERYLPVFENRVTFWDAVIKTSPTLAKGYSGRAKAYYAERDLENASAYFLHARKLSQTEPTVANGLGIVYTEQGKLEEAEQAFREELAINPNNTESLINLGVIVYNYRKDTVTASKFWAQALRINPRNTKAHEYLAVYYYERNELAEAIEHINALESSGIPLKEYLRVMRDYIRSTQ